LLLRILIYLGVVLSCFFSSISGGYRRWAKRKEKIYGTFKQLNASKKQLLSIPVSSPEKRTDHDSNAIQRLE